MATDKNYIMLTLDEINPENITFCAPKQNKHGGTFVPLKYSGKDLYIRLQRCKAPFGARRNTENGSLELSVTGDKAMIDKLGELDELLMKACIENAQLWGLGGTEERPIHEDVIRGYDRYGVDGKWKRLLKYSCKKDKATGKRTYLDFPPRLTMSVCDDTPLWDNDGKQISANVESVITYGTVVSVLVHCSNLSVGTYGVTLKPRAKQIRICENGGLPSDECFLVDDM